MKGSNNFCIHLLLYSFLKTSRCVSIIKHLFLTYCMLRLCKMLGSTVFVYPINALTIEMTAKNQK